MLMWSVISEVGFNKLKTFVYPQITYIMTQLLRKQQMFYFVCRLRKDFKQLLFHTRILSITWMDQVFRKRDLKIKKKRQFKATKDRDLQRATITHTQKGYDTQKMTTRSVWIYVANITELLVVNVTCAVINWIYYGWC